ncbi:MAG: hypothetical protein AMXMBFR56_75920 [Polyangiaceae bacterium]
MARSRSVSGASAELGASSTGAGVLGAGFGAGVGAAQATESHKPSTAEARIEDFYHFGR